MIIGLDVGGTHTDVVLIDREGLVDAVKVPTDADHLFDTVLSGIDRVLSHTDPGQVSRIVLSTTLTTNAIIQGHLPEVAMMVSGGPGIDPSAYEIGAHYHTVAGSMDHRGREQQPVAPDEIRAIGETVRQAGVGLMGIVGKFSVRNPDHENRIAELLNGAAGSVFLGHRLSGHLNFPRRIATTYLNAAVYPTHRKFYTAVSESLAQKGLDVPIRLLKADGGNMGLEASLAVPVQTINSGPAASVMGSLAFASTEAESLVMDIGGTTTDMAVLIREAPLLDPFGIDMGPYRTLVRSLNTRSVGIGGDSAVAVTDGRIRVGPERKGPAMAYGGPVPTPTDAMFLLDMMDAPASQPTIDGFAPIAAALGVEVVDAARQVFDHTCDQLLRHARDFIDSINRRPVYTVHEMLENYRVKPRHIYMLGGPALQFARRLDALSDFRVGVIPRHSVANAIGAALARTTCDVLLFADTARGVVTAPAEAFSRTIDGGFSVADAERLSMELLREKALARGADADHLETEIVEKQVFNMVRGFRTIGRDIRVRAQVKPGLIHGYDPMAGGY